MSTHLKNGEVSLFEGLKRFVIGKRLSIKQSAHERLTNSQGLAVFGADALSSTAYATEEILLALASAGVGSFFVSLPVACAITALIFLVTISYRQSIFAYPQGGGVYNVAKENLGEMPSLLGAASLIIDYVLTVAVSVAAGVAAITSAFPSLLSHSIIIGIVIIILLTWANLRGVRESGRIVAIPVYVFILSFLGMIGYGIFRHVSGTFPHVAASADAQNALGAVGVLLIFRAFASGCTAMTGIEATSNGVQAFKAPESSNAASTMMRMGMLLGMIFIGVTLLSSWSGVHPSEHETIISQVARLLFGGGPVYLLIQTATVVILLLAANTPFAGFPRVASQLAHDGYFPRQFMNLGSRLVFAWGIIVLAGFAAFLIWFFSGRVHALIPLYAVGVFLGFSISQLGMVMRWRRLGGNQVKNILVNGVGCLATTIVFLIVLMTKFTHGAWILVPAIVGLILMMRSIKRHYVDVERRLSLDGVPVPGFPPDRTMIVLVSNVDRAAVYAAKFARSLDPKHIRAVHIAVSAEEGEEVRKKWEETMPDVPIDIRVSEYRDLFSPVLDYLKEIDKKWSDDAVIAVIPEFIPQRFIHHFLHNKTALRLRLAIEQDPDLNVEILEVPVKVKTPIR